MTTMRFSTIEEIKKVEGAAIHLGIDEGRLLENAGRVCAQFARSHGSPKKITDQDVIIMIGGGGKGACGLVAARYLWHWGAKVTLYLTKSMLECHEICAHELAIAQKIGIPSVVTNQTTNLPQADYYIDAMVGCGLQGIPHGTVARLVHSAQDNDVPIIALDVPSGLPADEGEVSSTTLRATYTICFTAPKKCCLIAPHIVGDVFIADIGIPYHLTETLGLSQATFAKKELLAIG